MSRITDRIRYIGVNDYSTELFEGLWPLPFGVSYNSYLVIDEKIALIDTVEKGFDLEFLENIREEIGDRVIDYLIINHMEPDHSALIALMKETYPEMRLVCSQRAVPMIEGYYGIASDGITAVRDGDSISLGSTSLTFHMIPMVHWPETMVTWMAEEGTLFSGDAFGSFGALKNGITDREADFMKDEMIRYYADIVGKYGPAVQAAIKKLSGLEIKRICSTHGPVWEERIAEVISIYDRLSKYEADHGVCIAYGSMYGNTAKAAHALARELETLGIPYAIHDLNGYGAISEALRDVFKYDTLVIGSPTYNGAVFPPADAFMRAVGARQVKGRRFFSFGSFTWAAASVRILDEMAASYGFELIAPGKTFPQAYSKEKCDMAALAKTIQSA